MMAVDENNVVVEVTNYVVGNVRPNYMQFIFNEGNKSFLFLSPLNNRFHHVGRSGSFELPIYFTFTINGSGGRSETRRLLFKDINALVQTTTKRGVSGGFLIHKYSIRYHFASLDLERKDIKLDCLGSPFGLHRGQQSRNFQPVHVNTQTRSNLCYSFVN